MRKYFFLETKMIGAIAGDIAGSIYEFHPWQGDWHEMPLFTPKCFFTDDTVLTVAVADALMACHFQETGLSEKLVDNFHEYARRYPHGGYGGRFAQWLMGGERKPYNSFGNGSAMRVSPVGWAFGTLDDVEKLAAISASVTHNHPEGIKGAQAVAGSIFLARTGKSKAEIKDYVSGVYGYDLDRTLAEIRPVYRFDETCQGSVPEAIIAFMESDSFDETLRKAIWLRGDADTQAAIAGSIAEAFFGPCPNTFLRGILDYLDDFLRGKLQAWNDCLEIGDIFPTIK